MLNIGESPQRRKRIYLIADFRGQRAAEILFKRQGLRRDFKTCERKGQADSTGTGTGTAEHDKIPLDANPTDSRFQVSRGGIVPTLTCRMGTGGNQVPLIAANTSYSAWELCDTLAIIKAAGGHVGKGVSR